ncbi:hypothetical protein RFI_06754 [Reticulomyxa filosa]|uniref:Uncharacterized protein n=1 Tax=Reticulomyxa filosa TaxID=46433 RepID=X6NWN9_RETFI|nr:hypothetical protein RFI_06754 [Reticulomyxa filosa]|eukprot:ETO30366.1 hypothetical protein RFI_06754 [Reticulomyxa filosa]
MLSCYCSHRCRRNKLLKKQAAEPGNVAELMLAGGEHSSSGSDPEPDRAPANAADIKKSQYADDDNNNPQEEFEWENEEGKSSRPSSYEQVQNDEQSAIKAFDPNNVGVVV